MFLKNTHKAFNKDRNSMIMIGEKDNQRFTENVFYVSKQFKKLEHFVEAFSVFQHIRVAAWSTNPYIAKLFNTRLYDRFIEVKGNVRR